MSMTTVHQPLRQPTALPQRLSKSSAGDQASASAPKQQHESPGRVGRRSLGEVVCKGLDFGAGPRHPIQLIEKAAKVFTGGSRHSCDAALLSSQPPHRIAWQAARRRGPLSHSDSGP